jgi:hypothetical protein
MSLIERSFREKIVLVGLTVPPEREEETELHLDGRCRRGGPSAAAT